MGKIFDSLKGFVEKLSVSMKLLDMATKKTRPVKTSAQCLVYKRYVRLYLRLMRSDLSEGQRDILQGQLRALTRIATTRQLAAMRRAEQRINATKPRCTRI